MSKISYRITNIAGSIQSNDLNNIINTITYEVIVENDIGSSYGELHTVNLPEPDSSNFVEYSSLNEEQVISWIKQIIFTDDVTEESLKDSLLQKLEENRNKFSDIPIWSKS